jgi:hypothetical protein
MPMIKSYIPSSSDINKKRTFSSAFGKQPEQPQSKTRKLEGQ